MSAFSFPIQTTFPVRDCFTNHVCPEAQSRSISSWCISVSYGPLCFKTLNAAMMPGATPWGFIVEKGVIWVVWERAPKPSLPYGSLGKFWNLTFKSVDFGELWQLPCCSLVLLITERIRKQAGRGTQKISHRFCANPTGGHTGKWGVQTPMEPRNRPVENAQVTTIQSLGLLQLDNTRRSVNGWHFAYKTEWQWWRRTLKHLLSF